MANNKVPNFLKAENMNNSNVYNSGLYYGTVVSIEDDLNEGRIKVNIPTFDLQSKIFCKDISSNTLQTNKINLKRVQGDGTSTGNDDSLLLLTSITNIGQVDALTKSPNNVAGVKELDNQSCTEVPWAVPLLPKHLQVMPKVGEMCMVIVFNTKEGQQNRAWVGPLMSDKSKLSYESASSGGDNLNKNVFRKTSKNKTKNRTEDGEDLSKKGDFTGCCSSFDEFSSVCCGFKRIS